MNIPIRKIARGGRVIDNNPLFRNNTLAKKIYRSGELIYQRIKETIYLNVPESLIFDKNGETLEVAVDTNGKISITAPDWITYTIDGNTVTFTAGAASESREDVIEVISSTVEGTVSALIAVSQKLASLTIDLNNAWQVSDKPNPDSSLYDLYESFSNYCIKNGIATTILKVEGYTEITLYIRSYGENNYDYVIVSPIDGTVPTSWTSSSVYKNTSYTYPNAHTRGKSTSGTELSNYTKVTITDIPEGEHTIYVTYGKDGSGDNYDDKGYLLIPKNQ